MSRRHRRQHIRTLSGLQDEGDALPPWVVNPERGCSIRRADRVGRDSLVIEVTGFPIRRDVLTKERIVALDGWDRTQHLYL